MKFRVLLMLAALLPSACATQLPDSSSLAQLSGIQIYARLCSSCHGVAGRGDGPSAAPARIHVADLTRLAWLDGGEFPVEDLHRTIDGRWDHPAHGPRDMPVWGSVLYDSRNAGDPHEHERVDAIIAKLIDYLRSIQRVPPSDEAQL